MRLPAAGACIHVAHDVLELAEACAIVMLLLACLQAVVSRRLLKKSNVVGNLKHAASLVSWRWDAAICHAFAAEPLDDRRLQGQ